MQEPTNWIVEYLLKSSFERSFFICTTQCILLHKQNCFMEQNYQQQPMLTPPKNWLVESILVTLFCCLPFGVVGIVYASQVSSKFNSGDQAGALEASKNAAKWTKIGFFVGLAVLLLYIILIVVVGVNMPWGDMQKMDDYR